MHTKKKKYIYIYMRKEKEWDKGQEKRIPEREVKACLRGGGDCRRHLDIYIYIYIMERLKNKKNNTNYNRLNI